MAGRRLIVDTGIAVGIERQRAELADALRDDDDVAISAVSVAELLAGVELADGDPRLVRERFVTRLLERVPVIPYDEAVARQHARLLAQVRRAGRPRGAHDLIVAASALRTGRTVLTTDAGARFDDLPGVTVILSAR